MWKYLHRSVKNEGTVERLTNLNLFTNHRFKFYSTLKEQSFWRIPFKRRSKLQKWVLSTGIVSFIAFNIWWVYWPHHTFPKPVAKILRKGLHSEIKKEGANYQKSLEYYLEALEECKAENVDLLSDEYTGIEIKIGEMYEKLHMYNDATALYGDMLKKFYNELSKTTDKSTKRKFFLLKRDLQILVRFNEINKDSETNATLLIMHLLLAQREFLENSPEFKNVLSKSELLNNQQLDWKNFKGLPFIGKSKPDYQMHLNTQRKTEER
ncbi:ANL_HP_G0117790.mRNA.1.CDS.1 [Saccharomyces cerevisiae]|nr:ANL_HP_G0117790.mRNA.1.CDS.1 [Saccharomyces cerevisiae]CAI6986986.1 ANL_HP_G0117790.mRNA.1.CDS.1 [Saccharomyces cerevisiae]